jgi:hypothetical protein
MRLLLWCHVSGINTPIIPSRLMEAAHACLFTSHCSYDAAEVARLLPSYRSRMGVIHSAGGFSGLSVPDRRHETTLAAGYLGSLNFAKLHPRYVEFLSAVTISGFSVRMIGDIVNREALEQQCQKAGRLDILEFRGYTDDIAAELAAINVLPYLLNPLHYGTSENALLEAMAMGVVPIVLDNPAERCLVKDRETGLIVTTPKEFSDAVSWLENHPQERRQISRQASAAVRDRFAVGKTVDAFYRQYSSVRMADKTTISFDSIFGRTPAEWFLTNQKHPEYFTADRQLGTNDEHTLPGLLEKTKGSVFHYCRHFPEDSRLAKWAERLTHLAHSNG